MQHPCTTDRRGGAGGDNDRADGSSVRLRFLARTALTLAAVELGNLTTGDACVGGDSASYHRLALSEADTAPLKSGGKCAIRWRAPSHVPVADRTASLSSNISTLKRAHVLRPMDSPNFTQALPRDRIGKMAPHALRRQGGLPFSKRRVGPVRLHRRARLRPVFWRCIDRNIRAPPAMPRPLGDARVRREAMPPPLP